LARNAALAVAIALAVLGAFVARRSERRCEFHLEHG